MNGEGRIQNVKMPYQTMVEGTVPANPDAGHQRLYIDSADHAMKLVDSSGVVTAPGGIYPQDCIAFIHQFKITAGIAGGFTKAADPAQFFNTQYFQSGTPANGDKIQTSIFLEAGTYDVYILGVTANNRGKVDWAIDGAAAFISGQNWYNSGTQNNIIKTGTCTISAGGRHLLTCTVNGKDGSSSNYYLVISAVWFVAQSQSVET